MPSIDEVKINNLKMLAYGPSMSGKTKFIGTILKALSKKLGRPAVCLVLNFDQESNLMPLARQKDCGIITYEQFDVNKGYEKLIKTIVDLNKSASKYDLICLENGGALYAATMHYILEINKRSDSDGARIQDWGLANDRVTKRLVELINLNSNIYVSFHHQIEKDEIFGRAFGRLLVPGKSLPEELPSLFNMVFHFNMSTKANGEPDYWIACKGDNIFPAGDKTGTLSYREEPDFCKMLDKISGTVEVMK